MKYLGFMVFIMVAGCRPRDGEQSARQPVPAQDNAAPMIFVYQIPRLPGFGEKVEGGLVCACWDDGRFVRRDYTQTEGPRYVRGEIGRRDRDEMLRLTKEVMSSIPKSTPVHVDGGGFYIGLRTSEMTAEREVEVLKGQAAPAVILDLVNSVSALAVIGGEPAEWNRGIPEEWRVR